MPGVTHNHENYQGRLDFIRQHVLAVRLGLSGKEVEQVEVSPVQYDPACPFRYNNFVYRLLLPSSPALRSPLQHGCSPFSSDSTAFVLRLTNAHAEGLHRATRVENEVAMTSLAASALEHIEPHVVPEVYAWESAATGQGWILQQCMPGAQLDEAFPAMSPSEKEGIVVQMVQILKGLQEYAMPESLAGWGGVAFGPKGEYVSAAMTSVGAGPWDSLEASYRGRLRAALDEADENVYIRGWRENGVRERIDWFINSGLSAQVAALASKDERSLVHADFSTNNLLYDPRTGRITALLDYDFSSVLHPAHEFLVSFRDVGGHFPGWSANAPSSAAALRSAQLSGTFPSPLPANNDEEQWELASLWEQECKKQGVKRPSTIEGFAQVADVDALLGAILPWHVTNGDMLAMQGGGSVAEHRHRGEGELMKLLGHLGH